MTADLRRLADVIRILAVDAVEAAQSGHPGMPMGMAEAATVLFARHLKFDAADPAWPDRDRFVLSAGHGSMLLYAILHLTGVAGMTSQEIARFRQLGSATPGHPEHGHTPGVETTAGPLGQGLANAVGMALAERRLAARFGGALVDHRVWVIASDGDLMEGVSHEAIALAGHHRLEKLTVLWDDNAITIDGALSLSDSVNQLTRFEAAGWRALAVDGHDPAALDAALAQARASDRPTLIACRTVIGKGAPTVAGTAACHGAPLGAEEARRVREALDWSHPPFDVPASLAEAWAAIGRRGAPMRSAWLARRDAASPEQQAAFARALSGGATQEGIAALAALAKAQAQAKPKIATRAASGQALDAIVEATPELLGGSADLSGSNNTKAKPLQIASIERPGGRYIHYGVREHAMAAAMNGMALHGGVIPYGGTFLVFSDYCRPSLRLAAIMGLQVIHVMTHDSIGVGEDGPTHQPVEHLAALRAIPNLAVFRPADAVETAECWALALARRDGPSVLALSRQATPALRGDAEANRSATGAYELLPAKGGPAAVSLFATGTETAIAVAARDMLEAQGAPTRVVSVPCFELFAAQPEAVQRDILGAAAVRVGVEAAIRQGWDAFLRPEDAFIGMTGFGASAPAPALYSHFGITPERVAQTARAKLALGGL